MVNFIPAERKEDKELKAIKESSGKQTFFSWFPDGRVKEIYLSKKRKAVYTYQGKSLATSTDLAGNHYIYSYDDANNLTNIKYKNGTETKITYERKSQLTSSVTKRNGKKTEYKYGSNPKKPDLHYWTEVIKTGLSGKPVRDRYEYEIRIRPDGQQYTHRIATKVNGLETETVYSELWGLPLKIVRGKKVTHFEYNKDGLLAQKTSSNGKQVSLNYHKSCKKVSRVADDKGWTSFKYDKKCNLKQATNSKNKAILLIYDHKSQITKMVDHNKKTKKKKVLNFVYNAMGRPIEIKIDKVGKVNVKYDRYGGIQKVESKQGEQMAFRVTQTFKNVLAIVRPAGVSLSAN